MNEE
jgi:hypothetical protein